MGGLESHLYLKLWTFTDSSQYCRRMASIMSGWEGSHYMVIISQCFWSYITLTLTRWKMLHSNLKPFEERSVWFCLDFIQATIGFSGCSGFCGFFLFVCFVFFFLLFFWSCLGFFLCLVWGYFCYVKKHGLKHQVMNSVLPELNVLGREGLLVGSQFSALVPSHTDLKYEQSCKKLDLPSLRIVQVSQKQGSALRWLWTFAVHRFLLLVWCLVLKFCG